jgi:hypothetical protein
MEQINKTFKGIDNGDRYIDEMYYNMKKISEKYNVELTENAKKIARARVLTDCPLNLCICDRNDPERGCISDKCMKEIQESSQHSFLVDSSREWQ